MELFAKSPFEPVTRHARKVHDVAAQVRPLMDAFLAEAWDQTQELYEQISRLEHQADEIKQEIQDHLLRSLFLPVDRGDILRFLREQDGIADSVEDLAVLVTMRRTTVPDAVKPRVRALVDQVLEAAIWLQFATVLGLPVSTTYSIVGAVVGFGLVSVGLGGIARWRIGSIVASWVISPVLGGAEPYQYVERVFGRLQLVTAAYVAFAHGANDVANALGPWPQSYRSRARASPKSPSAFRSRAGCWPRVAPGSWSGWRPWGTGSS